MKYLILQNTIAPYRISLFNKLIDYGLDIELLFMCELERGRSWKIDYDKIKFPYVIEKGPLFNLRGIDIYFNPKFLKRFIKDKDTQIIMGSPWNFPDVIAACVLKRMGFIRSEIIFWSEANRFSNGARKKNKLRDWLRAFVYKTGEGRVIIPGEMASNTFEKWGIRGKRFIKLPNVIEEEKFEPILTSGRKRTPLGDLPKFVIPARLIESVKGLMNFFKAIGSDNVRKARFILLGDGPDEIRIRKFITENGYDNNITLGGFCSMEQMAEHYINCDCLLLPSFSDPSPLSLVEGCFFSMPLLVSNRCGNHFETVTPGENGYIFDPDNHDEIKEAFEAIINRRNEWDVMGQKSRNHFENNFAQAKVIKRFVDELRSSEPVRI